MLNTVRLSEFLLLLVAIVWGTSYGVAKEAIFYYPVLGFLAIRFIMTALILSPSLFRLGEGQLKQVLLAGIPLGTILLAIFIAETYGLSYTSASNAAFLISTCVVLTPVVEFFVLGTRPTTNVLLAIFMSLLGAFLVSTGGQFSFNAGDFYILIAAFFRACMVTMTKRMMRNSEVSNLALTTVQTAVVGFGSLAIGAIVLPAGLPALPTAIGFWVGTVYLVAFCTLFAFFVQNFAVRNTSPTRVSLLMGTEPVFGALFAVVWLQEPTTATMWVGGALIVIASIWGTLAPAKPVPSAVGT
ncbi:EamA family transporter [Agrobacterium vitis]|uniref:EamA family transporter n=1 Tax=Agrobacterium vitis TaxID=373 RepID=A0A6L6VAJ0_AGRVI|nr:DMT family transporter [Agrobacterium vitis]MUZ72766.1 EamA family transporter [Agrobacterium vitis]